MTDKDLIRALFKVQSSSFRENERGYWVHTVTLGDKNLDVDIFRGFKDNRVKLTISGYGRFWQKTFKDIDKAIEAFKDFNNKVEKKENTDWMEDL